jgi:cytochrome b
MLVVYIVLVFVTSEEENLLDYHAAFGYGIVILILFRVVWGFMGPRYSRFSQWPLSIKEAIGFILTLTNPKKYYPGHNPAASFVMLGIILVIFLASISGVLAYGIQEGKGFFAWLNGTFFKEMELFKETHELFSTLLLLLVGAHLGGIVVDYLLHKKSGTLYSIFSGYKNIDTPSATLTVMQKFVASLFLASALLMPLYIVFSDTSFTKSYYSAIDYKKEHPLFVEECASCHILYPPYLLPKRSWKKLMANLADHFGDDASLDDKDRVDIEKYLVTHSAETSTKEAAFYISNFKRNKKTDIIAITKTPYWQKRHKFIDKKIFDSPKIKSRANCKACHKEFGSGKLDDALISMPKGI